MNFESVVLHLILGLDFKIQITAVGKDQMRDANILADELLEIKSYGEELLV